MPYEGAGFLLQVLIAGEAYYILGLRIKKEADLKKDAALEIEYFGGKPEPADDDDPHKTALAELIEELGGNPLDSNWPERVEPINVFQPFSKKWIRCLKLVINDKEFERVKKLLLDLRAWKDDEMRDFYTLTNRSAYARKAIADIGLVPSKELVAYSSACTKFSASFENKMEGAKLFRDVASLPFRSLTTKELRHLPLRAFNAVVFAEYLSGKE